MTEQTAPQLNDTGERRLPAAAVSLMRLVQTALAFIGDCSLLFLQSVRDFAAGRVRLADLVQQMALVGVDSLGIVLLITAATGSVFAYYIANLSLTVGYTGFVGSGVAYAFLNELGPVLGGVAFAARVGAAIAAEIGTMAVTEQLDALRTMSVSPVQYLVAPRVMAAIIMLPLLILFADLAGVTSGYFFAGMMGVPHSTYMNSIYSFIQPIDLTDGLIKAVWFALMVGLTSCRQGIRTEGGASGVGRATTSSVVICVVLIFISDLFLTRMLTGPHLHR